MGEREHFKCSMCVFLLNEIDNLKKELFQQSIQAFRSDQLELEESPFNSSCEIQPHDISSSENNQLSISINAEAPTSISFSDNTSQTEDLHCKDVGLNTQIETISSEKTVQGNAESVTSDTTSKRELLDVGCGTDNYIS